MCCNCLHIPGNQEGGRLECEREEYRDGRGSLGSAQGVGRDSPSPAPSTGLHSHAYSSACPIPRVSSRRIPTSSRATHTRRSLSLDLVTTPRRKSCVASSSSSAPSKPYAWWVHPQSPCPALFFSRPVGPLLSVRLLNVTVATPPLSRSRTRTRSPAATPSSSTSARQTCGKPTSAATAAKSTAAGSWWTWSGAAPCANGARGASAAVSGRHARAARKRM